MSGNIGINSSPKTYKSWANGYRALIDTQFKKGVDSTAGIFKTMPTELWEDRMVEIGGIEDFAVWNDGQGAKQSQIREGYAKTFTQVPFGNQVPIGRLFKKFQGKDVNIVTRASTALGNRAFRHMQRAPFSLLNYGFSDTNTYLTGITGSSVSALLPSGKRLFSTVMPCSPNNSTTWSNAEPNNLGVSEEGLDSLLLLLFNQLDDQGEKKFYGQNGVTWMVPREQYTKAKRIVTGEMRSGTSDHDENAYNNTATADGMFNGSKVTVKLIPWLSDVSSTAHFVIADEIVEEEMPLVMLKSQEFYTDDWLDPSSNTVYVRGQMIYTVGALSGRGLAGSQGTDSGTYSA